MIKTREQLLDEIERETLAKVRDLLRRGSALFEGTPEWDPPKDLTEKPEDDSLESWQKYAADCRLHADNVEDYAEKLHTALEQLHAELVDFESESASALIDFDSLTRQYNIPILPGKGS